MIALLKSKRKKKKKKNRKRTLQPQPERKEQSSLRDPLDSNGIEPPANSSGHTKRLINKYLYGSQSVQRLQYVSEPSVTGGGNASFNLPSTGTLLGKHISVGGAFASQNLSFTEERPHSQQQIDHAPPGCESQYVLLPDGTVAQTQQVRLQRSQSQTRCQSR